MNVFRRIDGRYEGRIPRGKKQNGKRKFQYIIAKTKDEVISRIMDIRKNEASHVACSLSMNVIFNEWFNSISYQVKESTKSNYKMKADKHILPYFGEKSIDSIVQGDVYAFIQDRRAVNLSDRYITDIIILMKVIFKYAVKKYNIFNPMIGISLPKKKTVEIQLLDKNEQNKLQNYIADNHNLGTLGTALSYSTGIRIGELCALQWKDIDLEKRILTVSKTIQRIQCKNGDSKTKLIITDPKSESSKRKIPIPECMMSFLYKFKGKPNDYVVSGNEKTIEPRTMQYRFRKILQNAELPSVHFHALRHIFASTCVKLGFDIKSLSELLGHSSVEITLNRYVHSSFEQKEEYMKKINFQF